jgi:F-type H+-transporting ATPase subunit epsilon
MDEQSAHPIRLVVTTPEREVVRVEVDKVILPTYDGYIGFLPGHYPLVCEVGTGELTYFQGETPHYLAVSGGFAEVLPDRVQVLADVAETAEEIDLERAERAIERAREKLRAQRLSRKEHARVLGSLQKALARKKAAERRMR